jgi:predicted amidohydrolase YtcJ
MNRLMRRLWLIAVMGATVSCGAPTLPADLIVVNARVYTLAWPPPDGDGRPDAAAPHDARGWRPDAEAIAIRHGHVVFTGTRQDAERYRGATTTVRDLAGATVLPGLIDSHVHLAELGASLERVNLVGVRTEAEAIDRVAARAAAVPAGDWIVGWGWDEGAWANRYPDMQALSERVPSHPVALRGLHSFAVWGNRLAFERAKISASTPNPHGGEIKKDRRGQPTGILLNNAGALLMQAVPAPTPDQIAARVQRAFAALLGSGYVAVHEAGADSALLAALERAETADRLPVRVYAMLAARDVALIDRWRERDPKTHGRLVVRSVKTFYDGAMGSRGALFLEDYSDRPGHRGLGGVEYGFDRERLAAMARRGYQITIHAIGDRANREALDFVAATIDNAPAASTRPRIEHAQVVNSADLPRFAALNVIASMQPSHAVEDMPWAEARIGPQRIAGAYAWRTLRRANTALALNSDLPGTDYNVFYGLHSAVTRQNREREPAGGWRAGERLTIEEAIRGWTTWAAYAGFEEQRAGIIAVGRPADLTVMDIDPFTAAATDPARLLTGRVLMTIADGRIVFAAN